MGRWARVTAAGAAGALALALATGCTPEPAPSPTPTGFASADEAFAAAEATYRAYTDAVNNARINPSASPSPESFLTGQALTDSLDADQQMSGLGIHLQGSSVILDTRLDDWTNGVATISVCMDISGVRVLNAQNSDVTPETRGDRGALQVEVVYDPTNPLIATSVVGDLAC